MLLATLLATTVLVSTALADAISLTLGSSDGIWANARTDGANPPTCLHYNNTPAVEDENQVAYGRSGSSCPPSLDLGQQSGFGFDGAAPPSATFDSADVFLVGELTHYNRPIIAEDKLSHVELRIDLAFIDPTISTSLTYTLQLDETPNNASPCPYGDTQPCDDMVDFASTIPAETFGPIDGVYYTLQIVGFAPGEPGTCQYVPGETINQFVTEEGAESHACLFGRIIVAAPAIDIEKNPASQTVDSAGTAIFEITVTNEGNADLFDVNVTDALTPDCDRTIGTLAAGETMTYTCSLDNVTDDFTNSIQVTGDYADSTYSDTDSAFVDVAPTAADISVVKTATPDSVGEPGGAVTFAVTIENNASEPLTLTALNDDVHGNLDGQGTCVLPQTIPASSSYACSFTAQVTGNAGDSETDTITATLTDDEGNPVQDSDSATVSITDVAPTAADISVVKTATPDSVGEPGGAVTFAVTVENNASEPLTLTTLNDDVHGDLDGQGTCVLPQTIPVGSSYACSFTAQVTGNAGDSETDTITATLTDDEGNPVQDSDSATVSITDSDVSVSIDKSVSTASLPESGSPVDFTLIITNESVEPVTITSLTDSYTLSAECTALVGTQVAAGNSVSCQYTVDLSGADPGTYTNTASVTVADDEGNEDTDADTEAVNIAAIHITKSADPETIHSGDLVAYTYTVTNPGSESLSNVTVSDDKCAPVTFVAGDSNGNGLLEPDETWIYTCSATLMEDTTNTATVEGNDPSGTMVQAQATASVEVITPDIDLTISASADETYPSNPVVLTFSATNTGDTTLYNVAIIFNNGTPGDASDDYVVCAIAELGIGESLVCEETVMVDEDTTYSGAAEGQDILSLTVQDTGEQSVRILEDPGEEDGDADGDGTPDYLDEDIDGDGIPNSVEGDGDSDGDGVPDYQDTDSDNDGIPDATEGIGDTDGDGVPDYLDEDSDGDGIPDELEGSGDTDGDGVPDYRDLDSDGDGIPDSEEAVCSPGIGSGFPCDSDGDGTPDFQDTDSDGDGIPDQIEGSTDSDGDGTPNYRDLDSDDDGIPDEIEGYGDADGDGTPNFLDTDSDGDGLLDGQEWSSGPGDPLAGCTADDPVCFDNDVDGDGTPNYLDDDSDGDGILDGEEGLGDEDDDGIPDWIDPAASIDDEEQHYIYLPLVIKR
jgi:uncharacterized repeat protein (TIGR01451 family)